MNHNVSQKKKYYEELSELKIRSKQKIIFEICENAKGLTPI
jgi:hypothetical protein